MIAALGALALAAGAATAPVGIVRAKARPELPWVVAVSAFDVDVARADLERAMSSSTTLLDDAGAMARVELLGDHPVLVIEGPPEAHDLVIRTAHAAAITVKRPRFVLFVDGRTPLKDRGVLAPRAVQLATLLPLVSGLQVKGKPSKPTLPLAPTPGLLDVEGEALALFVEDALDADVAVHSASGCASLVIEGAASDFDKARAALETAVAAPLAKRVVDDLRRRARGRVAERRARAGGWARDMAALWLEFGTIEVDEPADLGSSLRARMFPSVLLRSNAHASPGP